MIAKGSVLPKDITIINIYTLANKTPKYTKQKLKIFKEIYNLTIIVVDFNNIITLTNITTRWKISKYTEVFKTTNIENFTYQQ